MRTREFVERFAQLVPYEDPGRLRNIARRLKEAGKMSVGAHGISGAHASSEDAAALLIALSSPGTAAEAVSWVKEIGEMRASFSGRGFARNIGESDDDLPDGPDVRAGLSAFGLLPGIVENAEQITFFEFVTSIIENLLNENSFVPTGVTYRVQIFNNIPRAKFTAKSVDQNDNSKHTYVYCYFDPERSEEELKNINLSEYSGYLGNYAGSLFSDIAELLSDE